MGQNCYHIRAVSYFAEASNPEADRVARQKCANCTQIATLEMTLLLTLSSFLLEEETGSSLIQLREQKKKKRPPFEAV